MIVIGLTGSIGMGKSTVAAMFRARGVPVFDADAEVHRLYASEAADAIERAFPGTTGADGVDRAKLSNALANDPARFETLERIVHPLVHAAEARFLHDAHRAGSTAAVLEIPLLLETGRDAHVDTVVVVSAPAETQRARVLERAGMSAHKLETILARQTPDAEKRRRADFIVDTGGSLADSETQVDAILDSLKSKPAEAYARHWL